MSRQVALLRAVNVGSARAVPMAALRELAGELGATEVATHLRSGNLVYTTADPPARMAAHLTRALGQRFGFEVPVLVRTAAQMRRIVAANPLPAQAAEAPGRLQVVFLSAAPPAGALDGLECEDVGDDAIRVASREVYVWSAGGITGSPALTALERRRLPVVATARNWRTVERLQAMLDD